MTTIDNARATRSLIDERLAVTRLGRSLTREMDRDMLALKEAAAALDALIAEHESLIAPPTNDALWIARNIINQIADVYHERIRSPNWVKVRQETNDELDAFAAKLVESYQPVQISDEMVEAVIAARKEHPLVSESGTWKCACGADGGDVIHLVRAELEAAEAAR